MLHDLHILPKTRDSWSYLYLEHARIEQEAYAIAAFDQGGKTLIPCATLSLLLLGPGTSITHAAVRASVACGCTILWVGEQGVRCYAMGIGETRSAVNLYRQARAWADPVRRLQVVCHMYQMRFPESLNDGLTLQQIRGKEGVRVREAYLAASREYGVEWQGRNYERQDWNLADPINRALSSANSCLYGICHAAILSAGYSPALGFIHTGKQLSFVYDVADLYKAELTIPTAFAAVAALGPDPAELSLLDGQIRRGLRERFHQERLLPRIVDDMQWLFEIAPIDDSKTETAPDILDNELAVPGGLFAAEEGVVAGGINYGGDGGDDYANDYTEDAPL